MKHLSLSKSLFICILWISFCLISCTSTNETFSKSQNTQNTAFDRLTQDIFAQYAAHDTLTLNYTLKDPSIYGIVPSNVTWGDIPVTPKDFETCKQKTLSYLNRLNTIHSLSGERALTYDVLKYYLELELEGYDYMYFTNNFLPMLGIQSQLPIAMAEYPFDDIQDVEDYIELLNHLDDYFTELIHFENTKAQAGYGMSQLALLTAIQDCKDFCNTTDTNMLIDIFPEKLEGLPLSSQEKADYIKSNNSAVLNTVLPAYAQIIEALTRQLETAPVDGSLAAYKNGADYYRYLLKSSVGTDKTPEELIRLTEANLNSAFKTINAILHTPEFFDIYSTLTYMFDDPVEILEHFKSTLTKELFPKTENAFYTLNTVHPSIAESLSPAMYVIPRIDDLSSHQIYLNLNTSGSSNELMPTLAHEGYPGHMYQTIYYYYTDPNPVRTIYECDGYIEGWASYVEGLSYNYCGFSENLAEFTRLFNLETILNLYCRLDLGIHYEHWSFEEACAFVSRYMNLDEYTISSLYKSILLQPTNYLIYGIGMEEIKELRKSEEQQLDALFDIKDFHKRLLDIGPAPFPIVKKYMAKDID